MIDNIQAHQSSIRHLHLILAHAEDASLVNLLGGNRL